MKKHNIKVEGYSGTRRVIDSFIFMGDDVYLLENEIGADDACLIVDDELCVISDDVYNGFDDLYDMGISALRGIYYINAVIVSI